MSIYISGCASWALKERCEKTNWFEYSQGVAFQGKYLEEDAFVKDCKDVDRTNAVQLDQGFKLGREKMCSYDEIYLRATQGQPVFFKFCDGLEMNLMKKKFTDGLVIFCTAERGYSYGKSGQVYQRVCAAQQEVQFLPKYFQGRKEYLSQMILDTKENLKSLSNQLARIEYSHSEASRAYYSIPNLLDCSTISVYNEITKKDETKRVCSEPNYIRNQRDRLYDKLSEISDQLRDTRNSIKQKSADLENYQKELNIIPI